MEAKDQKPAKNEQPSLFERVNAARRTPAEREAYERALDDQQ